VKPRPGSFVTNRIKISPYSIQAKHERLLHVLCAEDYRPLADATKRALEGVGHMVECVEDGQMAFDRVMADLKFFDLIITDHRMPGLSGLELVTKLREADFSGKIIVHTSDLAEEESRAYWDLSVDHILLKPILPSELQAAVCKVTKTLP
jgi:CheY-like chemotaxis protein